MNISYVMQYISRCFGALSSFPVMMLHTKFNFLLVGTTNYNDYKAFTAAVTVISFIHEKKVKFMHTNKTLASIIAHHEDHLHYVWLIKLILRTALFIFQTFSSEPHCSCIDNDDKNLITFPFFEYFKICKVCYILILN